MKGIILAGGKGTRMGSSEKHKVCFEVLGVPVIIRALETYNLCGAMLNVVVAGMMAESVMTTVNRRFPGTAYAFQDQPLGTGDADPECRLLRSTDRGESWETVGSGSQLWRAVGITFRPDAVFWGTDAGSDAGGHEILDPGQLLPGYGLTSLIQNAVPY
jgi:hypothetical protein